MIKSFHFNFWSIFPVYYKKYWCLHNTSLSCYHKINILSKMKKKERRNFCISIFSVYYRQALEHVTKKILTQNEFLTFCGKILFSKPLMKYYTAVTFITTHSENKISEFFLYHIFWMTVPKLLINLFWNKCYIRLV